jgi:hypothetical protein
LALQQEHDVLDAAIAKLTTQWEAQATALESLEE